MIMQRLREALGDARGKLRASDALALAGFQSPSYQRTQLVARALRELGWERGRYRHNGAMLYAYARGNQLEREVMLDVERGDDDRLVVRRREQP
jgi:hypothetical protein